jgi:hypothetical protein
MRRSLGRNNAQEDGRAKIHPVGSAVVVRANTPVKLTPKGEETVGEINVTPDITETLLDAFGATSGDFVAKERERLSNCLRARRPSLFVLQ